LTEPRDISVPPKGKGTGRFRLCRKELSGKQKKARTEMGLAVSLIAKKSSTYTSIAAVEGDHLDSVIDELTHSFSYG